MLGWQIPLPDKDVQMRIARNFHELKQKSATTSNEITHQESLVAKLKQAILQEAIQGKLTTDWRIGHSDVEPAGNLLRRVQLEKSRPHHRKETPLRETPNQNRPQQNTVRDSKEMGVVLLGRARLHTNGHDSGHNGSRKLRKLHSFRETC